LGCGGTNGYRQTKDRFILVAAIDFLSVTKVILINPMQQNVPTKKKVLYHHRTRGDGAEGVHICEMIKAFEMLGCPVALCCPPAARRKPGLMLGMTGVSSAATRGLSGWLRVRSRQSLEIAYNAVSFFRVFYSIARNRPDFIYERYSCYHFAGILAAQLLRVPVCLEVNSTYAGRFKRRVLGFPRFAAAIEKYVLNHSTVVAVVSNPLRECVADRVRDGNKTIVTPNAINEANVLEHVASRTPTRQRLGIHGDNIVIGFVGSLRKWHGVDYLVRVIPKILKRFNKAVFLIVGDGELANDLGALKSDATIADRLILTGGVSHSEVFPMVAALDVGLMPHSNEWGSPMKILEYMAFGTACIAPRLAPIMEIVRDRETGILFPAGNEQAFEDAMVLLIENNELRRTVGANARTYVLSERRWTDNASAVLEKIAGQLPLKILPVK
jgi:glycosyltransferase involved in cell wall biosynthesis